MICFYLSTQVSVIAPNVPALYEAHFGVPMAQAVLNAINTRLDSPSTARILTHCSAHLVIVDESLIHVLAGALLLMQQESKAQPHVPYLVQVSHGPSPWSSRKATLLRKQGEEFTFKNQQSVHVAQNAEGDESESRCYLPCRFFRLRSDLPCPFLSREITDSSRLCLPLSMHNAGGISLSSAVPSPSDCHHLRSAGRPARPVPPQQCSRKRRLKSGGVRAVSGRGESVAC